MVLTAPIIIRTNIKSAIRSSFNIKPYNNQVNGSTLRRPIGSNPISISGKNMLFQPQKSGRPTVFFLKISAILTLKVARQEHL